MTKSSDELGSCAPQRPKLWLLRTRRFWFGVAVLFFLISVYAESCIYSGRIHYSSRSDNTYDLGFIHGNWVFTLRIDAATCGDRYYSLDKNPGIDRPRTPYTSYRNPFKFGERDQTPVNSSNIDYILFVMESPYSSQPSTTGCTITLPLWLPVLLWLIVWPLWIRRLTRKEAAHFAKLQ